MVSNKISNKLYTITIRIIINNNRKSKNDIEKKIVEIKIQTKTLVFIHFSNMNNINRFTVQYIDF